MPDSARLRTNLALGAISLAVVTLVEQPLAMRLAGRVVARRQGLVQALPGAWLRDLAAILLLDYATYHWHVATHRVPLLWRLHRVHHSDQAMDWTTALRFHGLDMALSVPLRLAEVRLIGASPRALALYGGWFFANVAFHHADLKLGADRELAWFLTTPGMHDIHHRADAAALDSNYSSGLSLWDRVHGTFSAARPDVGIGIPGLATQPLAAALALPFTRDTPG
ncbi:sterol desaturase family protein [Polymorphobacter sp.]|uniref:sterol desaturase family protein n=1 Tax=Polymorphobacter sp. TaxID=1909290 RepID=UPI003F6F8A03